MHPLNIRFGFLALLYLFHLQVVRAATNLTVDDNDPSIEYAPPGGWTETSLDDKNIGGSHQVANDPTATATFTFTGVAVYFYSPLWPFRVTTALSLDGADPITLDLRDHTQPLNIDGAETTDSAVVWGTDGLDYTEHTLVVSVPDGAELAIVDAIMYTIPDGVNPTSTPSSTLSSTLSSHSRSPTAAAASASENDHQGLSIAIAIVCSMFGILLLGTLLWWWRRRKRQRAEEEAERYAQANQPGMNELAGDFGNRTRPRTTAVTSYGRRAAPPLPPFAPRMNPTSSHGSLPSRRQKALSTIPESFPREDRQSVTSSIYPFDNHDPPPESSIRLVRQEKTGSG